jgi:hypothetical protein
MSRRSEGSAEGLIGDGRTPLTVVVIFDVLVGCGSVNTDDETRAQIARSAANEIKRLCVFSRLVLSYSACARDAA